jgi:hypothetical protein
LLSAYNGLRVRQGACRTDNAMRFYCGGRRVFIASVPEQRPDVALVVDLDGLLRRGRVVARRRRLQNHAVDGSQDKQLAHEIGHLDGNGTCLRVSRASIPRRLWTCDEQSRRTSGGDADDVGHVH